VEAWMAQQPAMDFRGFMGGVVVNDEVKLAVAVIRELGVYAFQKGQEFLVAVALVASAQNSPGGRIVSGKQRKSPVTYVIMGLTLGQTQGAVAKWVDCAPGLESGSSHRHKARWLSRAD
jgi:predicted NACHT family NTPase